MSQRLAGLSTRCLRQYRYSQIPSSALFRHSPPHVLRSYLQKRLQSSQFQPLVPPSPASLGAPTPPKLYKRTRKWGRRLIIFSATLGTAYFLDYQFYASSLTRSVRTFSLGLFVAIDYKLNFREEPLLGGSVQDLHHRNAERLFDLLRTNGGLYLKIGQAIAMQSAVLPPEFQRMFARMFDDAPQNEWKDVEKVIREDFGGKSVEEVFGVSFTGEEGKGIMERKARASASVAQVHWARLADGREVAIKVQKREIAQQVGWDLWAFKVVMRVYTYWFDLPLYSLVPYITERLMLETDFENEASNSTRMAALVANEPRLKHRVYIPTVYPELSSKRILTAEWIEGVRLWDKEGITAPWLGGRNVGSPGVDSAPLDPPPKYTSAHLTPQQQAQQKSQAHQQLLNSLSDPTSNLKPDRTSYRGPLQKGGLGLSLKQVMTMMIDLFSAQIFLWGLVHCDPHPGNIFIRRLSSGDAQLVLIDHGLYISLTPQFRHQYSLFWRSLLTFDNTTLAEITKSWGINAPDLFASAVLMRPYEGGDNSTRSRVMDPLDGKSARERHFEVQQRMMRGMREVLGDETKWPRELIFIGRNMRIVQGNNQFLGSPVNRIKMTGMWASRALVDTAGQRPGAGWGESAREWYRYGVFRVVMAGTDVVWWSSRIRQWLGWGGGMEEDMERQMRVIAKETFGVELQHDVFQG